MDVLIRGDVLVKAFFLPLLCALGEEQNCEVLRPKEDNIYIVGVA